MTDSAAPARLRVVVADDDANVRHDLRRLLELEHDIEVVSVANDGQHAIEVCAFHRPDVVVMDVRMPVLDGISATERIRNPVDDSASGYRPAVLILTTFDLDEYVFGAIRAGAAGFLLKDQAPELLADAVRTVARGEAILAPRATARLFEEFAEPRRAAPLDGLTKREIDVLRLIAQGLSNEDIASSLFVSIPTVKTHVSNLLMKLAVDNRIQAVIWAYENAIVGTDHKR